MAKLTDTQLIVLSKAAAHDGGYAAIPVGMNRAAAAKVGSSLLARKLMREIRSKSGMPVWREDGDGRSISLLITRAGRDIVAVEEERRDAGPLVAAKVGRRGRDVDAAASDAARDLARSQASADMPNPRSEIGKPRPVSKQAHVIEMLSKDKGATLDALIQATGWQPHTTRAALTGLRKKGYRIERQGGDGARPSTWRIIGDAKLAA